MRDEIRARVAGVTLVVVALALAACGGPSSGVSGAAANSTATATTGGTNPPAGAGLVSLVPLRAHYGTGDTIAITLHNGLASALFVLDNHTGCTMLKLERVSGGGWQELGACVNEQPHPQLEQVKAGGSVTVQLVPGQAANAESGWPAGTYRAALTYVTSADEAIGQGTTVYSRTFSVG